MAPDARAPGRTPLHLTVGAGALFGGALTYVGIADPHRPGFLAPVCPFKLVTGWDCPACGGLRMTHDLLNGEFAAAVNDNVFLLVGVPLLALWVLLRRRRHKPVLPVTAIVVIAVATVTWTVVRNLPGFPLVPILFDG